MNKKSKIEWDDVAGFIAENRDAFDSDFPTNNHIQKFEIKLDKFHKQKKVVPRFYFKIAVSVALVVASSLLIFWLFNKSVNKQHANFVISQQTIEFREATKYYSQQVAEEYKQLENLVNKNNVLGASFYTDLDSMDMNLHQLETDLANNPNDERIMNAIIEHYRIKVDAINQMIQSSLISESQEKLNSKINRHEKNI